MHVVVTAPAGNIGRQLTDRLLSQGVDVTLIARNRDRVQEFEVRGANVEEGSLDDQSFVLRATEDADALFWLTPHKTDAADHRAHQRQMGHIGAAAIKANRISRVVNVSSVFAQVHSGAGMISGLGDVEGLLDESAEDVTHLRVGSFFDNYVQQIDPIRQTNSVLLPVSGRVRLPMVASRDIAWVAARLLLDVSWSGKTVRGVHGPRDLSFDEAAEVLSEVLGKEIKHVAVPREQFRAQMLERGLGTSFVDNILDMYTFMDSGRGTVAESRTPETTTPTSLAEFAQERLRPLLAGAAPVA